MEEILKEKYIVFDNESKIKDLKCPIFIIHGKKDNIIPVEHSFQLAKSVQNLYKWYPKKASHFDLVRIVRHKYYSKMKLFLDIIFRKNLDKIMSDLDLKEIYNANQSMNEKISLISKDFKEKIVQMNNKNTKLEQEILRLQNINAQKDAKIDKLDKQIIQLKQEKKMIEEQYALEKNNNDILNSQIQVYCNNKIVLEENKKGIYNLYFGNK